LIMSCLWPMPFILFLLFPTVFLFTTWGQSYKYFYGRNLQIFVIS
jgi:hypothetical protein